jgi:hypothetical protein
MSDTELLPKSKPEPVHQLEVFTGTEGRRAWTAEQKALSQIDRLRHLLRQLQRAQFGFRRSSIPSSRLWRSKISTAAAAMPALPKMDLQN